MLSWSGKVAPDIQRVLAGQVLYDAGETSVQEALAVGPVALAFKASRERGVEERRREVDGDAVEEPVDAGPGGCGESGVKEAR